ncbi:pectate lyase [Gracilibacillus caseinilyticus]|uniref:Pectate lyase n=1 Tax=Gracilibacillus caseinilyticus TaxID=2932256 RepID=A0ABY4EXU3_9BACI|nr:pectate lyase [Gracilibacillus caseinilyticus]UOQ48677.1 pectate lyase [Gracilibacillus caseinilyticus]
MKKLLISFLVLLITFTTIPIGPLKVSGAASTNAPTGLTANAGDGEVTLSWNRSVGSGKSLLYIGNDIPADHKTIAHLETLGFNNIELIRAEDAVTSDAEGHDIVFVGESGGSADIGQKFMNVKIPVIYAKGWVVDDVHLSSAASGDSGDIDGQTSISIQNSDHPLAAGFTDTVEIYDQAGKVNFGTPGEDAEVIATVAGDQDKATIFGYEKSDKRVNGDTIPARRVSTFLFKDQEDYMTEAGWKLFDASVKWALDTDESAKTFTLKRSEKAGGPYETVASGLETTSYTDSELDNGTTYYYVLSLTSNEGESDVSEEIHATPVEALEAPTGLDAAPGNGEVTLNWDAVDDATSYDVLRSAVDQSDAYELIANNLTEPTYSDTDVTNGEEYFYVVTAGNDVATSVHSQSVAVTPVDTSPVIELDELPSSTNEKMYTISGSVDQPSTVSINGEQVEVADLTFTHTLKLAKVENIITIEAVNDDGEAAEPVELTVTYETDAPIVTIDDTVGEDKGGYYQTVYNPYPIAGTMNEAGTVLINGKEVEVKEDLSFETDLKLTQGEKNTITIVGVDKAGNRSEEIQLTVLPDTETVAPGPIKIVSAEVLDRHSVKVTFNGKIANFDPNDLELLAATGEWESLNPDLQANFTIVDTTVEENEAGQTVVIYETEEAFGLDGTLEREVSEDPHHVPYLKADYYSDNLEESITQADNLLTWQIEHGGWDKNKSDTLFTRPWDGEEPRSESYSFIEDMETGTIDNNATIDEILFLALMYKETGYERYKESVLKGIEFLQNLQYETGGFAQAYPLNGSYQDNVTFNDNAMIRTLNAMTLMAEKKYPFNSDIISDALATDIQDSVDLATDYLVNAQIEVDGELTAWGQQHDPFTYEPTTGRAFEIPSISGFESVSIVQYLMALPDQTPAVQTAIEGALNWFDEVEVEGYRFERFDENEQYYYEDPSSSYWYRLYEIGTNKPLFTQRSNELVTHDIMDLDKDNRSSYMWAGDFAADLLQVANTTGYFENRAYVEVVGENSTNIAGETLKSNALHRIEGQSESVDPDPDDGEDENENTDGEDNENTTDTDGNEEVNDDSSDENDKEETNENTEEKENTANMEESEGQSLPDTATNMYNWLMMGGVIVLVGAGIFIYQRKKTKSVKND